SGTGPTTVAPARVTVSTILRAELSMTSWSYDFKRMRIFCPAISRLSLALPLGDASRSWWASDLRCLRPPRSGVSALSAVVVHSVLVGECDHTGLMSSGSSRLATFVGVSPQAIDRVDRHGSIRCHRARAG